MSPGIDEDDEDMQDVELALENLDDGHMLNRSGTFNPTLNNKQLTGKSFREAKRARFGNKAWILSINDPKKTQWDLFIMILATINCFHIPFDVAFQPPLFKTTIFQLANYFIDLCFFIDIIVSFRTSYINEKTGAEIRDVKSIARYYFKGQFTIDVLATLPFDTIAAIFGGGDAFKVFGALKLVRVLRLNKIITYLRSTEEFKAFLKLNKLVFLLVMYLHCFGCLWWMIVDSEQLWIPPMNYNDDDYYIVYGQEIIYKYFVSLHSAVLLTTGNDVGPRDTWMVIFGSVGLFLGAIINANIFGELAVLVS